MSSSLHKNNLSLHKSNFDTSYISDPSVSSTGSVRNSKETIIRRSIRTFLLNFKKRMFYDVKRDIDTFYNKIQYSRVYLKTHLDEQRYTDAAESLFVYKYVFIYIMESVVADIDSTGLLAQVPEYTNRLNDAIGDYYGVDPITSERLDALANFVTELRVFVQKIRKEYMEDIPVLELVPELKQFFNKHVRNVLKLQAAPTSNTGRSRTTRRNNARKVNTAVKKGGKKRTRKYRRAH